jgi:hypothetical protein
MMETSSIRVMVERPMCLCLQLSFFVELKEGQSDVPRFIPLAARELQCFSVLFGEGQTMLIHCNLQGDNPSTMQSAKQARGLDWYL